MINKLIIENLTHYIKKANISSKNEYEIYNDWVYYSGIIIKDSTSVKWIISYINDLKKMNLELIN